MRADIFHDVQASPESYSADVREAVTKLHQEANA
jgi:hypothetical protein